MTLVIIGDRRGDAFFGPLVAACDSIRLSNKTTGWWIDCLRSYGIHMCGFTQNISTTTGSKDLQMVTLTLRVLSRPDVEHLSRIYQTLGLDYDEKVLPSIGNEVLKSIVAQFDAAELITQREVVSTNVIPPTLQLQIRVDRCHRKSDRTYCNALESLISYWRMCLLHT